MYRRYRLVEASRFLLTLAALLTATTVGFGCGPGSSTVGSGGTDESSPTSGPAAPKTEAELRAEGEQALPPVDILDQALDSSPSSPEVGPGMAGALAVPFAHVNGLQGASKDPMDVAHQLVAQGQVQAVAGTNKAVFGPKNFDGVTYRLTVDAEPGKRRFMLEAKPQGAADSAYVRVITGDAQRNRAAQTASGRLGIDVDALKSVKPSIPGQGKILAAFAKTASEKALCVRVAKFTPDARHIGVSDADLGCQKVLASKDSRVRLSFHHDLSPQGKGEAEVLANLRFIPGVGAHLELQSELDTQRGGGTLKASACWDRQQRELFRQIEVCNSAGKCLVTAARGSKSACSPAIAIVDPSGPAGLLCNGTGGSSPDSGSSGSGSGSSGSGSGGDSGPSAPPSEMPPPIN